MSRQVALCLDEQAYRNPGSVGLEGERLDSQEWLVVLAKGNEARSYLRDSREVEEAWVISCEDVEPINLAATIKSDRPDLPVRLVAFDGCGSLYSRAHAALVDEVLDKGGFLRRYAEAKRRASSGVVAERAEGGLNGSTAPQGPLSGAAPGLVRLQQPQEALPAAVVAASRKGFILPIVSGSGGAGKSSVSVLAAHIAHRRGLRTMLLDYDLQFGDIAFMAGVDSPMSVDAALAHPDQLERECNRGASLVVLAAPPRLETADEVVQGLPGLIEWLSTRFDVVVANTGAAWAEQHAALLERSSAALFLVDQRMSSVRACRHALELCARCGIASGPFQFAVNRCAKGSPLSSVDVSCALQGAPVFELKEGGRDVEECLSGGEVDELFETGNEFVLSVERVMDQLLPRVAVEERPAPSNAGRKPLRKRGRHASRKRGRR